MKRMPPYEWYGENARLALDTLAMKPCRGIPLRACHLMDVPLMEEIAGVEPGGYQRNPVQVYHDYHLRAGTCFIDQYMPHNAMTMTAQGYDSGRERGATTGAAQIVLNGMLIDSPEAVVSHLETHVIPGTERALAAPPAGDDAATIAALIEGQVKEQEKLGPEILKVGKGEFYRFPGLRYGQYGYENYFMAYALYPEVIEKDFRLTADLALRYNAIGARAVIEGHLAPVLRLDHDMADSRGTLVDIRSLDRIWFPHFARCLQPFHAAGVRLLWHCDGNLMDMVPRLIEAGVSGFQGFQYEDGMDYERICSMTDRNGNPLLIWAGVSVTRTLPHGSVADVQREVQWLVDHGPRVGLALGASSSIAPGTNAANVRAALERMRHACRSARS